MPRAFASSCPARSSRPSRARGLLLAPAVTLLVALFLPPAPAAASPARETGPRRSLTAFADEESFQALLDRWRATARERGRAMRRESAAATGMPAPMAAPAQAKAAADDASAAESITNVQTQGVDEGGIVKRHGDHLVILRRGRLFTVRVGDDALRPVATLDAYAPDAAPQGAWYDELLIAGDTVVVIGYSYARGGTEIGLFDIDARGGLAHRATYHLRSNDYYASRNYASRLIGTRLIFYTPMRIDPWALPEGPVTPLFLPAMRRWHPGVLPADFRRILPATRIYRTDDELDPFTDGVALHGITSCDLARRELECRSTAVLGPAGRVFYVSGTAVYVWTTPRHPAPAWGGAAPMARSAVFRIPLDETTAPSALKTTGAPIDQLSFLEEAGRLHVLLRAAARGEGMWDAERSLGALALLTVPLEAFGDGTGAAPSEAYHPLPGMDGGMLVNRHVGRWLVYGAPGAPWTRAQGPVAYALRRDRPGEARPLDLAHGLERIEAMGDDALLVGRRGADLHLTTLVLDGDARLGGAHVETSAMQGEQRTHGFFYRATGSDAGLAGLPVLRGHPAIRARVHRPEAAILYLRHRAHGLGAIGELSSSPVTQADDGCKASCVDWYGNARPLFLGDRVFALLGYELIEGRVQASFGGERIVERRRISFAPRATWGR